MFDNLQELLSTLKQNKARAIMTGFSVAWGIFMLIILLGSGNGLQNGMENNFSGTSKNALWIWSRKTQVAYEGLKAGRKIKYKNEDVDALQLALADKIDDISGRFRIEGEANFTYNTEFGTYSMEGVNPIFNKISIMDQTSGRFINDIDMKQYRKVVVVSEPIAKALFKDSVSIGRYLKINKVPFLVVGTFLDKENKENKMAYIPLSTAQRVFNGSNKLNNIAITTNALTVAENKEIEENVRLLLAKRHKVSPDDEKAIGIWNTLEHFKQAQGVFAGIKAFVWVIGVMTIIAGIVGVSNIMIILVKERTKEIGVRKAIGATPFSIIRLVLSESIFITAFSGFFGLVAGMGVLSIVSIGLKQAGADIERAFWNPSADITVALLALLILIVAGLVAGYVPARRASAIRPIEALHDE